MRALVAVLGLSMGSCAAAVPPPLPPQPGAQFTDVRPVPIDGYTGEAMEPFISCDGQFLFFNNRNDPGERTDLFVAERIDSERFRFSGPVRGANLDGTLDAVPSVDDAGSFFFISTRSYDQSLATLYVGDLRGTAVSSVRLVPGDVSREEPGWLTMDAEVSRDGRSLYFADARFTGGSVPDESDLHVATRDRDRFVVRRDSAALLANLNSSALEFAPATSADGLELFFTRLDGLSIAILRSTRDRPDAPFGPPHRLAGIDGFVEAPTLTCDGKTLYFHRKDGDRYVLYRGRR